MLTVGHAGGRGPVATVITINVPPSIMRNDPNARAVVGVTAADNSIPTGQVTMSYSGFQGGFPFPHPLVNGTTEYTLDSLPEGTYQLTATYTAQGNYQASHATAMLTVNWINPKGEEGGQGPLLTPFKNPTGPATALARTFFSDGDTIHEIDYPICTYATNGWGGGAMVYSADLPWWDLLPLVGYNKPVAFATAAGNYELDQYYVWMDILPPVQQGRWTPFVQQGNGPTDLTGTDGAVMGMAWRPTVPPAQDVWEKWIQICYTNFPLLALPSYARPRYAYGNYWFIDAPGGWGKPFYMGPDATAN